MSFADPARARLSARSKDDASSRPLRVVLDARIQDGASGIQQTVIGLATGLSALEGEDQYLFLVHGDARWLAPHLGGRCRMLPAPEVQAAPGPLRRVAARLLRGKIARGAIESNPLAQLVPLRVPESDGTIERAHADVMHFTVPHGFLTRVPTVYNPHDLQHMHHPEFFRALDLRWRNLCYPTLSRQASAVIALTEHGKKDLAARLAVPADRIHVVGWAPPLDAYPTPSREQIASTIETLSLPPEFALFPAQTFPHKNHLGLLEGLRRLRDRSGLRVPVVCSGTLTDHHAKIRRRAQELALEDQVKFVGFVSPAQYACLQQLARLLVFPSFFEGFGMPVIEAFRVGVPVACSTAASLPEVAGDAALLFDPGDADAIAEAIGRLWTDEALRKTLAERGMQRVGACSWIDVARRYREIYRLVASGPSRLET
jgi:glycosyltransferase involved in cell wall biosynthesis